MQVYHDFFWYPDQDQRFPIRIRIHPGQWYESDRIRIRNTGKNNQIHYCLNLFLMIRWTIDEQSEKFLTTSVGK